MKRYQDLNVRITGLAGTGKTTVAHALAELLRAHGIEVELIDKLGDGEFVTSAHIKNVLRGLGGSGKRVRISTATRK